MAYKEKKKWQRYVKFAEKDRSLATTFLTPIIKPDVVGCRIFRVFAWSPAAVE